jgi:hypothetical protein
VLHDLCVGATKISTTRRIRIVTRTGRRNRFPYGWRSWPNFDDAPVGGVDVLVELHFLSDNEATTISASAVERRSRAGHPRRRVVAHKVIEQQLVDYLDIAIDKCFVRQALDYAAAVPIAIPLCYRLRKRYSRRWRCV